VRGQGEVAGRPAADRPQVMMVEETQYDEVLTCDHSYDNRSPLGSSTFV
jgi:hypothetical protein